MQKLFIKNRKGQNVCVLLEESIPQKGLAFVMHGLSGYKEELHITAIAQTFQEKGHTVLRFDTTNTFGESDGNYEDATLTNYYEDLQDVILWAQAQKWYHEPFYLSGHSLGGICTALYTALHPGRVKGLALISTVISGALSMQVPGNAAHSLDEWKQIGWIEKRGNNLRAPIRRLKWTHLEDRLKYDLLPIAHKITMPVLMIVGEKDTSTPPEHQKLLFEKLSDPKEMHIINGAPHAFRDEKHINEIKSILKDWIA